MSETGTLVAILGGSCSDREQASETRASTEVLMWVQPRTLTGYLIAIVIVFAILNGLAWLIGAPSFTGCLIAIVIVFAAMNALAWLIGPPSFRDRFAVFSAGFLLGALGMYIEAWIYGYRRVP